MSNQQQVISYADLSEIEGALKSIGHDIRSVHSELGTLNYKQNQLESELTRLAEAFAEFVEADARQKALQLAETRQGNLKQDLQIKFGYYAEVRRMATGILQAVDTSVVSDTTLKLLTEEVMIKAPNYWLAPALVCLAAWIRNDKTTNEQALNEALKRDDYKTTLFFMLVMRRLQRNEASLKWLERYFLHQNPHQLQREFILILEAISTGVFPPAARQLMMGYVKNWLEQLTQNEHFTYKQKSRWLEFFQASKAIGSFTSPLLERFSPTWQDLEDSMEEAGAHEEILNYFQEIFTSSADLSKGIKVQLDEMLSILVTNFDDEELPLQEEVLLNQLIIEMEGDKKAAKARMNVKKHSFDSKVDFLELLTNASFNPKVSGTSKVTQALAVSISHPWIVEAYDTFTAQCRSNIPQDIKIHIDGFEAFTQNGNNENELLQQHDAFFQERLRATLSQVSFPFGNVLLGILMCIGSFWAFQYQALAGIFVLGLGIVFTWNPLNSHRKMQEKIIEEAKQQKETSKEILRGCLAEVVDYRRIHTSEDSKAEKVQQMIASISPEDFSGFSKDTPRNIIQS